MNIPIEDSYIVVGDVHGCIDELRLLLIKNGFTIDSSGLIDNSKVNKSIILLGDFIDKASFTKLEETINFIYKNYYHLNKNSQKFYLIRGNHEEKVFYYLQKLETELTPQELLEKRKYYNTAYLLERDNRLKGRFLELYRDSYIWLKYNYSREFSITFTHAPCEERYLAKDDKISHKKMVKSASRSKNRGLKLDTLLSYLIDEAEDSRDYHIFGHLSQPNIRVFKNKICIDTGAIYGNSLSCAIIKDDKILFDSVAFQNRQKSATQEYNILFDF